MPGNFDPGPPPVWEGIFAQAPLNVYRQHPRFRTEFTPVFYRGRLDGTSRVLIVGQDPSTDEILAQRTLVGAAGQRVQGLLKKLGLKSSYTMFNTFLYGILGQFDSTMRNLSASGAIMTHRNMILDRFAADNAVEAVIAFGQGAQHAVDQWPGASNLTVFKLVHPTSPQGVTASWNQTLPQMLAAITPDPGTATDPTPYGAQLTPADETDIPRADLPFGIPTWHGTGGTRSGRGGTKTKITWTAPGD